MRASTKFFVEPGIEPSPVENVAMSLEEFSQVLGVFRQTAINYENQIPLSLREFP
jgi:hypothetical protein